MEPSLLKAGKAFHSRVQADWLATPEAGAVRIERTIRFAPSCAEATHVRRGRIDIFLDRIEDFVTVIEIKATDWDRILECNRRQLMSRHSRQVWRYIEKYLDDDGVSVVPAIIYPTPPTTAGLREEVETYLNSHGLQVVWFDE